MTKSIYFNYLFILLTLVSLQPVLAALAQPKQGFYVSNESLGIHGSAELVVFSDLYLDSTSIVGSGTLTLQTNRSTKIFSKNSKVNNLKITGKNHVALEGDLYIVCSLTLNQAIFDVSRGSLTMNTQAILTLTNGAQVLHKKPTLIPIQAFPSFRPSQPLDVASLNTPEVLYFDSTRNNVIAQYRNRFESIFQNPQFPPPKFNEQAFTLLLDSSLA
ncbi:hypothetical protein [Lacihabitans soyangensis]|uniref:Uncharacterized protein n=1 Tax=Lacihabitans soyangensis TaxID=869394 RepID=A0AAE3H4V2_9BACT|nr:hypothetical protein [Lacihabitans soyangensis]MCP9764024.1 hypothetical protein [Lacihabitans soyangensis]